MTVCYWRQSNFLTHVIPPCLCSLFRTHFLVLFLGYWVQLQRKAFPNGVCYFLHSLQANAGMLSLIRPRPLPATSFPIHYSWTITPFDGTWTELLAESLKMQWRAKFSLSKPWRRMWGVEVYLHSFSTSAFQSPDVLPPFPSPGKNPVIYRMWGWMGNPWVGLAVLVKKLVASAGNQTPDRHIQECKHICCTILCPLQQYTASHPRRKLSWYFHSVCFVSSKPITREPAHFHNTAITI